MLNRAKEGPDRLRFPELDVAGLVAKAQGKPEEKPKVQISPELFERHDYLVVYFENGLNWWNLLADGAPERRNDGPSPAVIGKEERKRRDLSALRLRMPPCGLARGRLPPSRTERDRSHKVPRHG